MYAFLVMGIENGYYLRFCALSRVLTTNRVFITREANHDMIAAAVKNTVEMILRQE
jgi:hypothetical protein